MRTANQTALAAFIASRFASRPHVEEMTKHLNAASLGNTRTVMDAYDRRTEDALIRLVSTIAPEKGSELIDLLGKSAEDAQWAWASLFDQEDSGASRLSGHDMAAPEGSVPQSCHLMKMKTRNILQHVKERAASNCRRRSLPARIVQRDEVA